MQGSWAGRAHDAATVTPRSLSGFGGKEPPLPSGAALGWLCTAGGGGGGSPPLDPPPPPDQRDHRGKRRNLKRIKCCRAIFRTHTFGTQTSPCPPPPLLIPPWHPWPCPQPRDALEGRAPQRRPQRRLDRRLEEVAKAVGGRYCPLQMPLRLALGVRGTVAGHRLGALEGGGGFLPPFQCIPAPAPTPHAACAGTATARMIHVLHAAHAQPSTPAGAVPSCS